MVITYTRKRDTYQSMAHKMLKNTKKMTKSLPPWIFLTKPQYHVFSKNNGDIAIVLKIVVISQYHTYSGNRHNGHRVCSHETHDTNGINCRPPPGGKKNLLS